MICYVGIQMVKIVNVALSYEFFLVNYQLS